MNLINTILNKLKGKFEIAQDSTYVGNEYWDWSIWIEASESNLDKIESVIYNLHSTFPNPIRIVTSRKDKFRLKTSGWGVFTIYARINFKDNSILDLSHDLKLTHPISRSTSRKPQAKKAMVKKAYPKGSKETVSEKTAKKSKK